MRLDFSKSYGEVHGLPGAVYEQNGAYFKADGNPATDTKEFVDGIIIEDDSIPPPVCLIEQLTPPAEQESGKTMEEMPNKHLRVLIESFGGEWTGRKAALEFMKGK